MSTKLYGRVFKVKDGDAPMIEEELNRELDFYEGQNEGTFKGMTSTYAADKSVIYTLLFEK